MNWIETVVQWAQDPLEECLEVINRNAPDGTQPYRRFLYHLAKYLHAGVCLEIGVESGATSAHLASAVSGIAVGIDWHKPGLDLAHLPFQWIDGDSTKVAVQVQEIVSRHGPISVVYQDSSHHYEASCIEWELYSPMMAPDGVWVCDDITPAFHDPLIDPPGKGMVQYFEERPGDKFLFPGLHLGNVIGVILRGEQ